MPELTHGYLMAGAATLCWGVVVVFIKLARTPGRIGIAVSMATGALACSLVAGRDVGQVAALPAAQLALFFVAGCLQFTLGVMLYYECVQRGAISVAVPITRAKIVIVVGLSLALGLESFRWLLLAAAGLVLIGGAVIGWPSRREREKGAPGDGRAVMLAILACTCWGVSETLYGMLPKEMAAITVNAALLACGLAAYLPYAALSGAWREILAMPRRDWLCYVGHGLISFAIAYVFYVRAVQIAGPPRVAIITSVYPLISALIGFAAFRERLRATVAVGAVLLVGGVVALQLV